MIHAIVIVTTVHEHKEPEAPASMHAFHVVVTVEFGGRARFPVR